MVESFPLNRFYVKLFCTIILELLTSGRLIEVLATNNR